MLVYLTGFDASFAFARPYRVQNFFVIWNLVSRHNLPMFAVRVVFDLLEHCFDEVPSMPRGSTRYVSGLQNGMPGDVRSQ